MRRGCVWLLNSGACCYCRPTRARRIPDPRLVLGAPHLQRFVVRCRSIWGEPSAQVNSRKVLGQHFAQRGFDLRIGNGAGAGFARRLKQVNPDM